MTAPASQFPERLVIEMECGITVYPARAERGRWRHPAPAAEAPQTISPFAPTHVREPAAAS